MKKLLKKFHSEFQYALHLISAALEIKKLDLTRYCAVSSIVNEVIGTIYFLFYFIFFMKRLIHANKTQDYLYTFYASSCLFFRFTHKHIE